ncbi:hypothetical protein B296_00052839 [Ensete ventricosum]|uniref:Uncharacterized protein n=1 Tax=Ensete ventricosum TaxID=4639 RepID=A0A426XH79_ENSVE|nr:hypothetical protein B296_00052839 [Ensete ventricosum]
MFLHDLLNSTEEGNIRHQIEYLDFDKAGALSDDDFDGAVGFGAPVAAFRVHGLARRQLPCLLAVRYHRLFERDQIKKEQHTERNERSYLSGMGEEELLAVGEGIDGGKSALALPSPPTQKIRERGYRRVQRRRRRRGPNASAFHSLPLSLSLISSPFPRGTTRQVKSTATPVASRRPLGNDRKDSGQNCKYNSKSNSELNMRMHT